MRPAPSPQSPQPQPDISLGNTPGGGYSLSTRVAPMQQATPPLVTLPSYTPPAAPAANSGWDDWLSRYMQQRQQQAMQQQMPVTGFGASGGASSPLRAASHVAPDRTQENIFNNQMAMQQRAAQDAQQRATMANLPPAMQGLMSLQGTGFNMTPGYMLNPNAMNAQQRQQFLPGAAEVGNPAGIPASPYSRG